MKGEKNLWYGGDYNPEQWDEKTIDEDIRLMKEMHITCVTLGVFSWTKLEPEDGKFDFEWLDNILDRMYEAGIDVILATPTTAMPYWLTQKYEEVLHVDIDGRRVKGGSREKICPNSPVYRKYAARIAGKLAERYGKHPAVKLWHINNEYHFYCYCETCAEEFRIWLKERYGTIDAVNKAWNTTFWSHIYTSFEQILPPDYLTDIKKQQLGGRDTACFQGLYIDYMRFMTDSVIGCIENEKKAIRQFSDLPVTNNFSDFTKRYDYRKISKVLDVVSYDNYPLFETPLYKPAFAHDMMRSMKNKPFNIMEQAPNNVSWTDYCPVKRPGEVSDICWQSMAHGADSELFFQWRQSRGAVEKFHEGMIPHSGRIDTRQGRELVKLGEQLENIGEKLRGAMPDSKVAILFDWENWWAIEGSAIHNCHVKYHDEVLRYYRVFYEMGISVDIVCEETFMDKEYDLIIAPCFYMCSQEFSDKIKEYVNNGGTFLTTFFSGLADRTDNVILGGYPGAFRELLGIRVDEIDALFPYMTNSIVLSDGSEYECTQICDLIKLEGASAIGLYGKDFYKDTPCVTKNKYGKGQAFYVGTTPEHGFLRRLLTEICSNFGIKCFNLPEGIEMASRMKEGKTYRFIMNHTNEKKYISLEMEYTDLLTQEKKSGTVLMEGRQCMILVDAQQTEEDWCKNE